MLKTFEQENPNFQQYVDFLNLANQLSCFGKNYWGSAPVVFTCVPAWRLRRYLKEGYRSDLYEASFKKEFSGILKMSLADFDRERWNFLIAEISLYMKKGDCKVNNFEDFAKFISKKEYLSNQEGKVYYRILDHHNSWDVSWKEFDFNEKCPISDYHKFFNKEIEMIYCKKVSFNLLAREKKEYGERTQSFDDVLAPMLISTDETEREFARKIFEISEQYKQFRMSGYHSFEK